jgi:hypothetical protein
VLHTCLASAFDLRIGFDTTGGGKSLMRAWVASKLSLDGSILERGFIMIAERAQNKTVAVCLTEPKVAGSLLCSCPSTLSHDSNTVGM